MNPLPSFIRRWAGPLLAAASALPAAQAAPAWQPAHTVTIVVPYAPGGGTDATARALARRLGELWGQPVIVDNQPGADGLLGTRRAMDAKPDGLTLLLQVPSLVLTRYQPGLKGIDPLAQLVPVTAISQSPGALVVSGRMGVHSVAELVRACKTTANPCAFGTGEATARIGARQLAAEGGFPDLVVANYRGTSAVIPDLVSNRINIAFISIASALPQHRAGMLRILATQGDKRAAVLPDVPTIAEAGFPGLRNVTWYGLFAPHGTPPAVQQAIADAVHTAVRDAGVQTAIAAAGAEPVANSPAAFATEVRADVEHFGALVRLYPIE